ncbi:MAG: hypothetical protein GY828_03175 [Candidatus Gracilibacteria bacterium]|nr:hypothetical protein [Candidatus Gracilibacteria bacterium]
MRERKLSKQEKASVHTLNTKTGITDSVKNILDGVNFKELGIIDLAEYDEGIFDYKAKCIYKKYSYYVDIIYFDVRDKLSAIFPAMMFPGCLDKQKHYKNVIKKYNNGELYSDQITEIKKNTHIPMYSQRSAGISPLGEILPVAETMNIDSHPDYFYKKIKNYKINLT